MNLKQSLFVAILLGIISIAAWELYWRSQPDYYHIGLEDDRYLWAEHRSKVEDATPQDIVLLGSSRTGFNFDTHVWKDVQGIKPINLSADGKPPGPMLADIVENTNYSGTIVIGITPLMWFGSSDNQRWRDANKWVEHYHNQTYAQKLGHWVSKPLQRNLVMLTSSELEFYNDLDLKSLVNRIEFTSERPANNFKLYNFSYIDEDRNINMFSSMVSNPSFAKKIQDVWNGFLPTLPEHEMVKDGMPDIMQQYIPTITKFKERGGKLIFIRHKAEPGWNTHSERMLPRAQTWDVFIEMVDCPGYHWEDYEFMSKYTLPDWSHMNAEDAKSYTRDLVNELLKNNLLQKAN